VNQKANTMTNNYDGKKLPETILLNGEPFKGLCSFINGYNGYSTTEDDGLMCAIINNSCWDANGKPNLVTDIEGVLIHSTNRRCVQMHV